METRFEVIAGQAGAELIRRGIDPQQRIIIAVDGPQTDAENLPDPLSAAQRAMSRILEIQKRVKPDPDGLTIHDYINRNRP